VESTYTSLSLEESIDNIEPLERELRSSVAITLALLHTDRIVLARGMSRN
jgi:hypothetical protein